VELKLSEVLVDNQSFRIDSEYFKKEYLRYYNSIEKLNYKYLYELTEKITNGHTPLKADLSIGDVKFITAEFIDDFIISNVSKFISKENSSNFLKRSKLRNGDIIFTIKGKVGNAVPIFNLKEELNINQDVARLVILNDINHFYLSGF